MNSLEDVTRMETFPGMNLPKRILCKLCAGEPLVYDATDTSDMVILREWTSFKTHFDKVHNMTISRVTQIN